LTQTSSQPSRRRTAWHEAGHAVVAWVQDFTVVSVSIRPAEDGSFGRSVHSPVVDCSIQSERVRDNIVAMGCWAAELASGEAGDTTYDSGDVTCLLSRTPEELWKIELGWAEQEAERIVRSNIHRVERLATVLLERTELTDAAEIKAVIEGG